MANYKKLTDVEVMEEVSENSMALVNENGVLKQVPCGAGFGGGGGVATAIIKEDGYDNALAGVAAAEMADPTYSCVNMTFDEAVQTIMSGEPLRVILMSYSGDLKTLTSSYIKYYSGGYYAVPTIRIGFVCDYTDSNSLVVDAIRMYWTSEGVSGIEPEMPK